MGKIKPAYFIGLLFLLLGNSLFAQSIEGVVKNAQGEAVSNAGVILKNAENKTVAYAFSKANGSFSFPDLEAAVYTLQCNALGYEKQLLPVDLSAATAQTLAVTLAESTEELQEIVIDIPTPIKQKNDTIVFDVKSFLEGNESNVEDLLKKLPGLQVTDDGTVKVGNQEIEKIMVDGDDFFEKGYKVLSKNMPVQPLKEVELLKNYSNNKHLKGIENSDKVALNLKLDEDAKRQWFGNVDAGYGAASENRYTLRTNAMNFGKKNKYYFLANLNNLGYDTTGDISHLIRSSNDFVVGDNQSATQFLSLAPSTAALRDDRTNFNNAEMLSLNSIFTLSDKTKLKAIAFLNTDEQNFYRNSYDWFSDGTTTFENTEDYYMRRKRLSAFGKIDLSHDFSKKSTLDAAARFNYADNKDQSSIDFNGDNLAEQLKANTNFFDAKVVYTTKPTDRKVWIVAGRFISEETPQNYGVNQFVYQDLFAQNAQAVNQKATDRMSFYGLEAKYMDRKSGGNLLEFTIGAALRNDDLNTAFYLLNAETAVQPNGFQNQMQFQNHSYYADLKYTYQLSQKFRVVPSAKISYLNQQISETEKHRKYNPLLIEPSVNFNWELNGKNKIQAGYQYNWQTNDLLNMYSGTIHKGFRNFSTGYDDFTKFANHNAHIMYTLGNWSDRFFLSAMAGYSFADEYFSSKSVLTQNYSVSEPVVLNNRTMAYYNLNADYYFKQIKSNLKLSIGGNSSHYQNYVNQSDIRDITSSSLSYGLEMRSGFNGIFNYHVGTKWDYTKFVTTAAFDYTNNRTFVNLNFRFSKKWYATWHSERYHFGNLSQNKKDFYFSDLNINHQVSEKLKLSFVFNNIFNTDTFVSYSLSDISISETSYRLIPRYALLKAEWRF